MPLFLETLTAVSFLSVKNYRYCAKRSTIRLSSVLLIFFIINPIMQSSDLNISEFLFLFKKYYTTLLLINQVIRQVLFLNSPGIKIAPGAHTLIGSGSLAKNFQNTSVS